MSYLQTRSTATVTTSVSSAIPTSLLLEAVQDHRGYASRSPFIFEVSHIDTDPAMLKKYFQLMPLIGTRDTENTVIDDVILDSYEMKEKIPWYGRIRHCCGFKNLRNGVDTVVRAPMGVWLAIRFRISVGPPGGEHLHRRNSTSIGGGSEKEDRQRFITEEAVIEANRLLMSYIKWNWTKAHRDIHASLLEELEEKSQSNVSASS